MTGDEDKVPAEVAARLRTELATGVITMDEWEAEMAAYPAYRRHQEQTAAVGLRQAQEADSRAEMALRRFVEGLGGESWPLGNDSDRAVAFVRCDGRCGSRRVGVIVQSEAGLLLVEDRGKGHAPPELIEESEPLNIARPRPACEKCGELLWPSRLTILDDIEHGRPVLAHHASIEAD